MLICLSVQHFSVGLIKDVDRKCSGNVQDMRSSKNNLWVCPLHAGLIDLSGDAGIMFGVMTRTMGADDKVVYLKWL